MRGLALALTLWATAAAGDGAPEAFLAPARDRALLDAAIAAETPQVPPPPGATGLTVPHHLLVPDLIARGFWAASSGSYDRVILIAPDHFRAVRGRFATADNRLETVYDPLAPDPAAVGALLTQGALFERADVCSDHGLFALPPLSSGSFPTPA